MYAAKQVSDAIGISLAPISSADSFIQRHPIAMTQASRDTSNHFEHDYQQPEKNR